MLRRIRINDRIQAEMSQETRQRRYDINDSKEHAVKLTNWPQGRRRSFFTGDWGGSNLWRARGARAYKWVRGRAPSGVQRQSPQLVRGQEGEAPWSWKGVAPRCPKVWQINLLPFYIFTARGSEDGVVFSTVAKLLLFFFHRHHDNSWTAARSFMKFCTNTYLDNRTNVLNIKVIGQRSRSQDQIFGFFTIAR